MERTSKTIFQLDSPYTATEWPPVSPEKETPLLELLCNFLAPIGRYKANYASASNGRRHKKRKRTEGKLDGQDKQELNPQAPEISSFVVVGLNHITRRLESLSQRAHQLQHASASLGTGEAQVSPEPSGVKLSSSEPNNGSNLDAHFAAIFVPRSSQPPILHAHLPQLVAMASLAHPEMPPTRLVQLPKVSDTQLCAALGIPRVSFIGLLEGAPHAKALVELVRSSVAEVGIPWLDEAQKAAYKPLKINAIQTSAPIMKKNV